MVIQYGTPYGTDLRRKAASRIIGNTPFSQNNNVAVTGPGNKPPTTIPTVTEPGGGGGVGVVDHEIAPTQPGADVQWPTTNSMYPGIMEGESYFDYQRRVEEMYRTGDPNYPFGDKLPPWAPQTGTGPGGEPLVGGAGGTGVGIGNLPPEEILKNAGLTDEQIARVMTGEYKEQPAQEQTGTSLEDIFARIDALEYTKTPYTEPEFTWDPYQKVEYQKPDFEFKPYQKTGYVSPEIDWEAMKYKPVEYTGPDYTFKPYEKTAFGETFDEREKALSDYFGALYESAEASLGERQTEEERRMKDEATARGMGRSTVGMSLLQKPGETTTKELGQLTRDIAMKKAEERYKFAGEKGAWERGEEKSAADYGRDIQEKEYQVALEKAGFTRTEAQKAAASLLGIGSEKARLAEKKADFETGESKASADWGRDIEKEKYSVALSKAGWDMKESEKASDFMVDIQNKNYTTAKEKAAWTNAQNEKATQFPMVKELMKLEEAIKDRDTQTAAALQIKLAQMGIDAQKHLQERENKKEWWEVASSVIDSVKISQDLGRM